MKVFDVEITAHNEDTGVFTVRYCVDNGRGIIRRSRATYSDGHLSRDNENPQVIEEVKKLFKK